MDVQCIEINVNNLYEHSVFTEEMNLDLHGLNEYQTTMAEFYFKESDIQSGSFLLPGGD